MIKALQKNWQLYLIEAWALGMFMVSATAFTILLEHPSMPAPAAIPSPVVRRFLIGLAMGTTAVLLIYSPWGKRSGAHMNPSVTLTFLMLKRITLIDAIFYIIAQCTGGLLGMLLMAWLLPAYTAHPSVNYIVTLPYGVSTAVAFLLELFISFVLLLTILIVGNTRMAAYAGFCAGILITIYITFEAPYTGMSMNPARTLASALPAHLYTALWLYFTAPVTGMLSAGWVYRYFYVLKRGSSITMRLHLNHKAPGH